MNEDAQVVPPEEGEWQQQLNRLDGLLEASQLEGGYPLMIPHQNEICAALQTKPVATKMQMRRMRTCCSNDLLSNTTFSTKVGSL